MTIIKWRDAYNTGVAQFDAEHHKLVELIDSMYSAVRDKSDKEIVLKNCDELVAYTLSHFVNEEEAMAEVNYPELDEHKVEHLRLRQQAGEFRARIETDFPDGVKELYHFLRDWLTNHIQERDKKYGPFLNRE